MVGRQLLLYDAENAPYGELVVVDGVFKGDDGEGPTSAPASATAQQQQSSFLSIVNRDKKRGGRGLEAMLAMEDAEAESSALGGVGQAPPPPSGVVPGGTQNQGAARQSEARPKPHVSAPRLARPTASAALPAPSPLPKSSSTASKYDEAYLNKLAAKAMKARLKGKIADAERLEEKLRVARAAAAEVSNSSSSSARNQRGSPTVAEVRDNEGKAVEVVAPYDIHGRRLSSLTKSVHAMPLERGDLRSGRAKGKRKATDALAEHSRTGGGASNGGKKVGVGTVHASTDNNYSLADLVRMEKEGTADGDMDRNYFKSVVQAASKGRLGKQVAGSRAGADEEDDVDMRMWQSKRSRLTERQRQAQDIKKVSLPLCRCGHLRGFEEWAMRVVCMRLSKDVIVVA